MADPIQLPEVTVEPEVAFDPSKPFDVVPTAKFDSSKPWESYSAQSDPDPAIARGVQRKARAQVSQSKLDALYGREPDKYDYGGSPFLAQVDVASASDGDEIRLALEKHADTPEGVGQDKKGRWWIERGGKKLIVDPEMLSKLVASSPSTILSGAGSVAGAVAGTALLPGAGTAAGAIIGGGIGGMAGRGFEDAVKWMRGNYATPAGEEMKRLGWAGLENAAFSAIAPAARGVKEGVRSAYRMNVGTERHKEAIDRATRIWIDSEGKVIPPIESYNPEASRLVRAEQNRNLVSYGGISPEDPERMRYMVERIRRVLRSQNMPESEIDAAVDTVISGRAAASGVEAGEGIVGIAQKRVKDAEQSITADTDLARNVLRTEEMVLRRWADKQGRLGKDLELFLEEERKAFYGHFDAAYGKVNKLGGDARVVDLTDASAAAERLAQTVEPGSVPPLVSNIASLRSRATQLTERATTLREAGDEAGAEAADRQAFELLNRTVEEAHGLRVLLRDGMRAMERGGGPVPPAHHFLSVTEDAVDRQFEQLVKVGTGLPQEAAKELARVGKAYGEGIKFFKNNEVKKITRDAMDGSFAAPEVIARNIFNPNEVEAARAIWQRMPFELKEQVLAADMRNKLNTTSVQDTVTGEWVIKGKTFLSEWKRTKAVNEIGYPAPFRANVERWASELAAFDGHLELSAVKNPSQISQALAAAASKQQELDAFIKSNPVGALASGNPQAVDKAVRHIATPGNERATEEALGVIGRGTPEWQRLTHWAMINLFEGALERTPAGETKITGERVLKVLNSYTPRQQEMLFPGGLVDDIRVLGEDVFALFPRGGDLALGLSSGTVTNSSVLKLNQLMKQMRFFAMGKIADSTAMLALVADIKREHLHWDGAKTMLGQMGRALFNAEIKPPETAK